MITIKMVEVLMNKALAERAQSQMNLDIYLTNPVGVGEHPDIIAEADKLVEKIATAQGKIDVVENLAAELNRQLSANENTEE